MGDEPPGYGEAMFVVTVTVEVAAEHLAAFRAAILKNAATSRREPGCRQFDVSFSDDGARCFLYEVYADRDAFAAHRTTPHFLDYARAVEPWVRSKKLETWTRVNDPR